MIKLEKNDECSVHIDSMKDGDVAVIVEWGEYDNSHVGEVVQRYKNALVVLGKPSANCWTTMFTHGNSNKYRVRILKKGEKLVVEQ